MHIRSELQKILQALVGADALKVKVERPSSADHGDYATSIALALGKQQGIAPQQAASQLVEKLKAQTHAAIGDISIAGPGFINLRLSDAWLTEQAGAAAKSVAGLGKSTLHKGEYAHLEFISANPTGPLTLANARGGFLGDVLGNVLQRTGYKVVREFYVNDRGNQVGVLAESVLRRYWQQQGITIDYPETC